jgi:peptide/nickel transport system substrate-binding protein
MGSGPWEVTSLDPTTGAQLTANPDWWGGEVPVQQIQYKFFATETSLALAFRAGAVDIDPLIEDSKTFASTSGARLLSSTSCLDGLLWLNTAAAPWSDVHVRQAVAYAIDRPEIVAANGGYAVPDYSLIPPQAFQSIASPAQIASVFKGINLYRYNLSMAKREMAESAYPHGFNAPFLVWSYGTSVDVAQVIVSELAKIGINLRLEVVPLSTLNANQSGPQSKIDASLGLNGCTNPDVSGYDFLITTGNISGYDPAAFEQLLNAGVATSVPGRRLAIFAQVLKELASEVPVVPLYLTDFSIALSSNFTGPDSFWQVDFGPFALDLKAA